MPRSIKSTSSSPTTRTPKPWSSASTTAIWQVPRWRRFKNVLDPREGVYYFGGNKVKPAGYIYPNGSFLAVNGLDKPTKVKSFECDIAYINEASECSVEDIEFVRMRLRKGNNPFQQIIMDTNPDAPTHWLNQRCNDGVTTPFSSPA